MLCKSSRGAGRGGAGGRADVAHSVLGRGRSGTHHGRLPEGPNSGWGTGPREHPLGSRSLSRRGVCALLTPPPVLQLPAESLVGCRSAAGRGAERQELPSWPRWAEKPNRTQRSAGNDRREVPPSAPGVGGGSCCGGPREGERASAEGGFPLHPPPRFWPRSGSLWPPPQLLRGEKDAAARTRGERTKAPEWTVANVIVSCQWLWSRLGEYLPEGWYY
ncbi:hypothetical protein NDU88_004760 [Pleurodeles waltl]|uniref:Uncharacterized protein n=1 Tax=Pleurodeles waltl TaxID=8319 RepID=A0AAV7V5C7_PLEWA|nr:hypothetical protein NDU88_004760 [Pleurodeles waltl]